MLDSWTSCNLARRFCKLKAVSRRGFFRELDDRDGVDMVVGGWWWWEVGSSETMM